jgi:Predicted xylanase/chitin deacetylase
MKAIKILHAIGSAIAIVGLMLVLLKTGQVTYERVKDWHEKKTKQVSLPNFGAKVVPTLPKPKPPTLPPDYSIFALCYHDFRERPSKWSISPKRLETHIQTLKALGFSFLTMSEVVDLLTGRWNGRLPERAVVITVDDGFQSAYTVLLPLLKRYNAKATLFVYTSWIGKTPGALTWEQLREMVQSGLVEIASHTVTHVYPRRLKRSLSDEQFKRRIEWEFVQSKRELERRLGVKVEGLAYPGGHVDETLKALARKAGYRWAAVINPKPITVSTDLYALPRYGVSSGTTVAALKAWVTKQPIQLVRYPEQVKEVGKATTNAKLARNKFSTRTGARRSR